MTVSRRLLLVGLIATGSQLAGGCYCNRPYLFPRLHLCGQGACGGPVFPRLAAAVAPPIAGPVVTGPVYDAPLSVAPAPVYGGPIPGGDPNCVTCGVGGTGIPLGSVPFTGVPIAGTSFAPPIVHTAPPVGATPPPTAPATMPSASTNGIPFDSSLAPTVKPPAMNVRNLDNPPDSKKLMTAAAK